MVTCFPFAVFLACLIIGYTGLQSRECQAADWRWHTNGPALPARPAPPVSGGRPPPPVSGRQTDGAPALPRRPSPGAVPLRTDGAAPTQPSPPVKPPERPVSVALGSDRKRPEITIVCARPMSEVGFRSDKAAVSPSPSTSSKPPEVPGKPSPPNPRNVSPTPGQRVPSSIGSENLIDFDSEGIPPSGASSFQTLPKPSGARPPPPKPTPARIPPVPKKEEAGPNPPSPAKRPGPPVPRAPPEENTADLVSKPPRAQSPKVPSKSCDTHLPSELLSTSDLNELDQQIHNEQNTDIKDITFKANDAHNQINTPSHVLASTGDEYAVINKPKRPTIIRPGRPVVKESSASEDKDTPKPVRNPPVPSPRMTRKDVGTLSADLNLTNLKMVVKAEEPGPDSTPEFLKLKLKSTVGQSDDSSETGIDRNKAGKAPPPVLAPKPKPGVLPKPQVMAKPKLNKDSPSNQVRESNNENFINKSVNISVKRTNIDEHQRNEAHDEDVIAPKSTSVKRPTIIRPAKSQSVEKLSSSESLNSGDKANENLKQVGKSFNHTVDDSSLRPKPRNQPPLPNKRPVSMINIPKTVEHDIDEITTSKSMNFASGDSVDKPKPVPRPVARARPMSMVVPLNKHVAHVEDKSDLPPRPLHRPAEHETSRKVPIGVAVLPQLGKSEASDTSLSPPKPVGRPPPPKVSPRIENAASSDDDTKSSPQGPPKPGRPSLRPPPPKVSPKVEDNSSSDEDMKASSWGPPKPGRPSDRPPMPRVSPKNQRKDEGFSEEEFYSVVQEPPRPPPPTVRQSPPQRPSVAPPRKSSMKDEVESVQMRPPRPDPRPTRPLSTPGKVNTSPGPKPARPGSMAVKKTGVPELPGRPGPGHPLYHHMMKAAHGVALHDFTGSQHDELSFKTGQVIILVKSVDAEWLVGQVGEREGMFPRSFIKVKIPLPGEAPDEGSDSESDTEEMFYDASSEKPDLIGHGPRCRARFDFDGEGPEDLIFEDGDVIKLLERVGPEWRRGELNGKVGLFPLSFVDVIEDLPADGATSEESVVVKAMFDYEGQGDELSFQRGDTITVQYKVNDEWLYGECGGRKGQFPVPFVDHMPANLPPFPTHEATTVRDPLAEAESMWGNEDHSPLSHENPPPHAVSPKAKQPKEVVPSPTQSDKTSHHSTQSKEVPYCIAIYDFTGETAEDLGFVTGDRIELLEHIGADWLKGSLRGNTGIFPAGFVEIHKDLTDSNTDSPKEKQEEKMIYGIAQYDFKGESENELTFEAGNRLKLLEKVEGAEDWQWGELNGNRGMFPAVFVHPDS